MFLNIADPRERKKKTTLVLWNENQKVPSRKSVSKIQRIPCGQGNLDGGQIGYTCSNLAGNIVTFPAGRPPIKFTELSTVQISSSENCSDWNSTCTNPNITLKKHTFKTSRFIKKATGKNIFPRSKHSLKDLHRSWFKSKVFFLSIWALCEMAEFERNSCLCQPFPHLVFRLEIDALIKAMWVRVCLKHVIFSTYCLHGFPLFNSF